MPADREMAGDPCETKMGGNTTELRQESLENQREPDDERLPPAEAGRDLDRLVPDIDHLDGVAMLPQHSRQIAHAQIALVLITDQDHIRRIYGHDRRRPRSVPLAELAAGLGGPNDLSSFAEAVGECAVERCRSLQAHDSKLALHLIRQLEHHVDRIGYRTTATPPPNRRNLADQLFRTRHVDPPLFGPGRAGAHSPIRALMSSSPHPPAAAGRGARCRIPARQYRAHDRDHPARSVHDVAPGQETSSTRTRKSRSWITPRR